MSDKETTKPPGAPTGANEKQPPLKTAVPRKAAAVSKPTASKKPAATKRTPTAAAKKGTTKTTASRTAKAKTQSKTGAAKTPAKSRPSSTRKTSAKPAAETTARKVADKPAATSATKTSTAAQNQTAKMAETNADFGSLDASEVVFFAFGIILYSLLGLFAFGAVLLLRFVHIVILRGNGSIAGLCTQLDAYISQILAYAADPGDEMPFPFSPLPPSSDENTEK